MGYSPVLPALCALQVPASRRLERLSVQGRHLLHTSVSVEMWYGVRALSTLKVVVAVDCEQEHQVGAGRAGQGCYTPATCFFFSVGWVGGWQ